MLVALLLHIPLLIALPHLLRITQRPLPAVDGAANQFSLTVIEEDPTEDAETRARKEREEKRKKLQDELDGQFISEAAPQVEETPDKARFLDRYASKVEEETVRPDRFGPKRPTVQPTNRGPESQEVPTPEQPTPPKEAPSQKPAPEPAEMAEQNPGEDGLLKSAPERAPAGDKAPNSKKTRELFPTLHNSPAQRGGGGFDYLRDVPEGEKTLLNRKRSRYWSFMQRLKEGVEREWSPGSEYRRRDPYGNVYGVADRFTNLNITLNSDGSIRTIYIAKSSGLDFYDKEALRAVRAASPFPNPPEGLKDQDGLIKLDFGFWLNVSTGSASRFQIRRR